MARHLATIVRVLAQVAVLACGGGGGGGARPAEEPKAGPVADVKAAPPAQDTEEDRDKKRRGEAAAIVPDGSKCLPAALHNSNAPHLELAAVGSDAMVCAIDEERTRLLGPIACWSVEIKDPARIGALTYQPATPLPGRGFAVVLDDRCARGYCLPMDAKVPPDPVAQIAWNLDGSKVAVLAGDSVHVFDAASKAHESSFSIRGDKGVATDPTGVAWNGDEIFIEASDGTTSPVYVFHPDGTAVGPIEALGGAARTPLSTRNGSFMLLDRTRVAISEQGMSALTIYELDTGKRTKLVRKLPASACKKEELDAAWRDPSAAVSPRCKEFIVKNFAHLIGADAVAGTKNLLVLLRGPRLGELAVIDSKTLAEHKVIKMPWCDGDGADKSGPGKSSLLPSDGKAEPAKHAAKKSKPKDAAMDDPDAGGQ